MTSIDTAESVRLETVKGFSPGDFASSVHGAQARILQTLGESMTYEDLICYGAFAFRVGVHEKMCPSAGHPCCGYMCIENSTRGLPWKLKFYEAFPGGEKKPDDERAAFEAEVCAAIKDSIDRGVPVHYGSEEDGLIIGYADEGRRWWCTHPYEKWGAEPFWYDEAGGFAGGKNKWPWGIVVWLEPKSDASRASDQDLTSTALRQAVDMWNSKEKHGDYFSGDAAYEHWLGWLRGVEAGEIEDFKAGMQGNGWCFDVLMHSRPIAAKWLRKKAPEYDEGVRLHLLEAAGHYEKLTAEGMDGIECPWTLCPGPDKAGEWTSEMRQKQIARLEVARGHDSAAITAIAAALESLE